jgi:hypothetical protein
MNKESLDRSFETSSVKKLIKGGSRKYGSSQEDPSKTL